MMKNVLVSLLGFSIAISRLVTPAFAQSEGGVQPGETSKPANDQVLLKLNSDLLSSWLAKVEGDSRPRTLKITKAIRKSEAVFSLDATFGFSDIKQSEANTEIRQDGSALQLVLTAKSGAKVAATQSTDGSFEGTFTYDGKSRAVKITKLSDLQAAQLFAAAQEKVSEQVFIPAKDRGFFGGEKDIKLEVTLHKPKGIGPFPVVIISHGSTGNGAERTSVTYKETWMAKFFAQYGFVTIAPMRRGRGASDGNAESSEPERISCDLGTNINGVNNAMQDMDAVIAFLGTQAFVDLSNVVLLGVSRGGLLSLVYTADRPSLLVKGVVNFVGGWSNGDLCRGVNEYFFQKSGEKFDKPSLWIYGERDANYSDDTIRTYAQLFDKKDGNLTFRMYSGVPVDGHRVNWYGKYWEQELHQFLQRLGFKKQ